MIQEITVVGGTHGNEYLGITMINRIQQLGMYQNGPIPVSTLLANPRAAKAGSRFIDIDLNRCFCDTVLSPTTDSLCYEHLRARDVNSLLGPKPNHSRFIIDLHSTTSNMGMTLILKDPDEFNLKVAVYTQQQHPEVKLILSDKDQKLNRALYSVCQFGLTIEVGPVANALVRHDLLLATEAVLESIIKGVYLLESASMPDLPAQIELYKAFGRIPFPQTAQGELSATLHKDLQDQDFHFLNTGDPAFYCFDNKTLGHQGTPGYPIFINEAAYYRENTAYVMTEKVILSLS